MSKATKPLLFSSCSLLMASLFALSASFQFNDPDWYVWIPLYIGATIVNLVNAVALTPTKTSKTARSALWVGLVMLMKVVIEDVKGGMAGIWSLDMRERVVREKFGSGLVVISMFLHLKASSIEKVQSKVHRAKAENHVKYGKIVTKKLVRYRKLVSDTETLCFGNLGGLDFKKFHCYKNPRE